MFNFLKRKDNNLQIKTNVEEKQISPSNKIINELEEKFSDNKYCDLANELLLDERFIIIYRYIKELKDSLIVASTLKQIEISLQDIISAYSLDEEYVNKLIADKLPELRVRLYKELEELPNKKGFFGSDFNIEHYGPLYQHLIDCIEYFFETKRNTNKIIEVIKNQHYQFKLINNQSFLFLLNYFSVKDSLIIASSLDVIDIDEDEISNMYNYDDQYVESLLNNSLSQVYPDLIKRIEKLKKIKQDQNYFEYQELAKIYLDLKERIDDTIKYLNSSHKKR